jgi:hypothetical protein
MKRLGVLAVAFASLLLLVACGGGSGGVDPALDPAYRACVVSVIEEDGYTEAHASSYCECLVNEMAKDYSVEKVNTMFVDESGANLGDMGAWLDAAGECLSR